MIVLAIDTSGKHGSIALAECGAGDCRVLEVVSLAGGTYSAQLMPQIAALLARHHVDKNAIGLLAAASGPGSFTGLRVGLSTVKALAEALDKPIVAASLLEALAWRHGPVSDRQGGKVAIALDAGRRQVFLGEYLSFQDALPQPVREVLLDLDELASDVRSHRDTPLFTPDDPVGALLRDAGLPVTTVPPAQADLIARIGALQFAAGQVLSPEALDANYIRRSDAEIFSR